MKKIFAAIVALLLVTNISVWAIRPATAIPVDLQCGIINPTPNQGGPQRTPAPEVYQDGYNMYVPESLIGDTLQLVDEDSNVVYSIVITDEEVNLPTTLTGTYELQIIHDNLCFYGDIEL